MILLNNCPICKSELELEIRNRSSAIETTIQYCRYNSDNHFYGKQLLKDDIIKLKIRLIENNNYLNIRFDYELNFMEVWSDSDFNRIRIEYTFVPDFSDIEKLKSKIKTYLLFS